MYHIRVLFQTNSERRRRFQYSISACTAISLGSIFFSFLFLVRVLDWIPFQLSPRVPGRTVSERLIHQHLRHRSLSLTVTYLEASLNTHLGVTFSLSFSLWIPQCVCVCVCVCAPLSTGSQHLVITFLSSHGAKKKQHSRCVTFILRIDVAEKVTLSLKSCPRVCECLGWSPFSSSRLHF